MTNPAGRSGSFEDSSSGIIPISKGKKEEREKEKELTILERSGSTTLIGENKAGPMRGRASRASKDDLDLLKLAKHTQESFNAAHKAFNEAFAKLEKYDAAHIAFNKAFEKLEQYDAVHIAFNKAFRKLEEYEHAQEYETKRSRVEMLTEKWDSVEEHVNRGFFDVMREMKHKESKGKEKILEGRGEKVKEYEPEKEKEASKAEKGLEESAQGAPEQTDFQKGLNEVKEERDKADFAKSIIEGQKSFSLLVLGALPDWQKTIEAMEILRKAKTHPEKYSKSEIKDAKENAFRKENAERIFETMNDSIPKASFLDIVQMRLFLHDILLSSDIKKMKDKQIEARYEQLDRVLAVKEQTMAAKEGLEQYNHNINAFLERDINGLKGIVSTERLEQFESEQRELRELVKPIKEACDQKHEMFISRILSTKPKGEKYNRFVEEFVKEINENSLFHFGQLSLNLEQGIKENMSEIQGLSARSSGLRRFALYTLLSVDNPKERTRVYQFFLDAADQLANTKHDYFSGLALWGLISREKD